MIFPIIFVFTPQTRLRYHEKSREIPALHGPKNTLGCDAEKTTHNHALYRSFGWSISNIARFLTLAVFPGLHGPVSAETRIS